MARIRTVPPVPKATGSVRQLSNRNQFNSTNKCMAARRCPRSLRAVDAAP